MSEAHLQSLRDALANRKWVVVEELEGNEYDISAVWNVARPDGKAGFSIEFESDCETRNLPISKSYACHVSEVPEKSLYFSKISGSWGSDLELFMRSIDE